MGVVSYVVELASYLAVFQSTTLSVLGMVCLLFVYRKLTALSHLKPGEVSGHFLIHLNLCVDSPCHPAGLTRVKSAKSKPNLSNDGILLQDRF